MTRKEPLKHSVNFCLQLFKGTKSCVEAVLSTCQVIIISIMMLYDDDRIGCDVDDWNKLLIFF